MNILGVVAHTLGYGDSSAVLSVGGKVVGIIEEERLSRKRHDDSFPQMAIKGLLEMGDISGDQIDIVSLHLHPYRGIERRLYCAARYPWSTIVNSGDFIRCYMKHNDLGRELRRVLKSKRFRLEYYPHHQCHAAAAFYSSDFDRAAYLTIDGAGEGITGSIGTASLSRGLNVIRNFPYPHSLGMAYSAVSDHLGFPPPAGPAKIMGLASYGDPRRYLPLMREIIGFNKGEIRLRLDYFIFHKNLVTPLMRKPWVSEKFALKTDLARRDPSMPLEQSHMDLAAALQIRTNEMGCAIAASVAHKTGEKNLCIGGGVALNSVMNGAIAASGIFENIYIQPGAGDSGNALGSLYLASVRHGQGIPSFDHMPYAGPEFTDERTEQELKKYKLNYRRSENIPLEAAKAISQGLVIGWFQGRMEYGPRALGNRSILADPQRKEMRDILNQRVKHREWFRPFAPSVIQDTLKRYFTGPEDNPFMLIVTAVRDEWVSVLPSVTHVDKTARVQSVRPANRRYYELIKYLGDLSGHPVVLNTSFNDKNSPIVCTPEDAIECFLGTEIDQLHIGSFIAVKR